MKIKLRASEKEVEVNIKSPTLRIKDELAKMKIQHLQDAKNLDAKYEEKKRIAKDSFEILLHQDIEAERLNDLYRIRYLKVILCVEGLDKFWIDLISTPETSEFWADQDLHQIDEALEFFRAGKSKN